MNNYEMLFKRKSFHIFRDIKQISDDELLQIENYIQQLEPLVADIKTDIRLVKKSQRGGQYCLYFFSEVKPDYLANIGYLGQQLDLFCTSLNIGTLWYGIGKSEIEVENMEFVIMIVLAKVKETAFRKDMFKAKRKSVEEIWQGELLPFSNVLRFAPSACNSQPWLVERNGHELKIYRYKKPGKRGIMPIEKVSYYNRIDIGIFMFILEVLLKEEKYHYSRKLFIDDKDEEYNLVSLYCLED